MRGLVRFLVAEPKSHREWWRTPEHDRWGTAVGCSLAAFALGQAVQVANGRLSHASIRWLTLAMVAALIGVVSPSPRWVEERGERLLVWTLGAGLAWQFSVLFTAPPGIYLRPQGAAVTPAQFYVALAVAMVLACGCLRERPWLGRLHLPALIAVFLYLGRWILLASPSPFIDVFMFQRDGAAALLRGHNPYALRYPDIYGSSPFYGEGLSVNGVLQFGYPYMPLSLLLVLPGHLLGGDFRYAQLVAMASTAALVALAGPGRVGLAAGAMLLFTPRVFFVLEQGWTEPFVSLGLAAVAFCALRWPKGLALALGLLLAAKQYTLFTVPAVLKLVPRPVAWDRALWWWLGTVVGVGAAVTLPFMLWGPRDFWHDVVALQVHQPFRNDALSYLAWVAQDGGPRLPTFLAVVAALTGLGLGLLRLARTPAGFAGTCALTYLGFFAFNKQAFCNYYYFLIGALLVTVGATAPALGQPPSPRTGAGDGDDAPIRTMRWLGGNTVAHGGEETAALRSFHGRGCTTRS